MPPAEVHVSLKELARLCAEAGFAPDETPEAAQALAGYLELLMKWNRVMNLVGTRTWQATFRTLIVDSLHLARFLRSLPLPEAPETWDLGAGAGLPGIPLRAVWQVGIYHLVDAREKRTLFLSNVLARHPLPGTVVFRGRVEEFMPTRPKADCVVSRGGAGGICGAGSAAARSARPGRRRGGEGRGTRGHCAPPVGAGAGLRPGMSGQTFRPDRPGPGDSIFRVGCPSARRAATCGRSVWWRRRRPCPPRP